MIIKQCVENMENIKQINNHVNVCSRHKVNKICRY